MKKKILIVAGARPNFMKIAPVLKEFKKREKRFDIKFVHTGQHYDFLMSEVFFKNLDIPKPDYFLNVGSGSHAEQTAKIMLGFEKVMHQAAPDLVVVVGDVNSTAACSLVVSKLQCKVAHIEAGLRSFDRNMPEEINRLVTDVISDYLFVSEKSGMINLEREGIPKSKVFFVGNVMIDTLRANLGAINKSGILKKIGLFNEKYCVVTLHRPSNVDSKESLREILDIFMQVSRESAILYPIHPRTRKMIEKHGLLKFFKSIKKLTMIDPLGYVDFIHAIKSAEFILTDSGGIQEESTYLGVPCLTMRNNTERPSTVKEGSNILVGRNKSLILDAVSKIMLGKWKKSKIPALWDGKTSKRIVDILEEIR